MFMSLVLSFFNVGSGSGGNKFWNSYFSGFVSSYECGFSSIGNISTNFSLGFLLLLVFFVLLDVEVVLLFNYCLNSGWCVLICYLFFLLVVFLGFLYEIVCGFVFFKK
uniref:NADH-ubiquinone oxidoreductase chain 3 n=1 Tax=Diplorchis hangzhouensis TaxID=1131906 RepID=A0A3G0X1I9_9PLAT|nr:NADH dehydrogenase subunit 3 [Diplorchis hangzhouensis]